MIRGFDVSAVQGILDVPSIVAAGYQFAILKCQQGNDGKDPDFETNRKALNAAGILVSAYHFVYPLPHLDPAAQAEIFFKASDCGTNVGDLPVCVDFEWPAPELWAHWGCTAVQIGKWFKSFLEKMTELFGHRPVVYTYPWFITALLQGGADLSFLVDYPLWMADYSHAGKLITEGMSPLIPKPWQGRQWFFWQHDGNGGLRLPNGSDADFDVFNGTFEDLQKLAAGKDAYEPGDGPTIHPIIDTSE